MSNLNLFGKSLENKTTINQWSHNPYSKNSPDKTATDIAKKYIVLFDKALHDMGIHMVTGVEIEFDAGEQSNDDLVNYLNGQQEKSNRLVEISEASASEGKVGCIKKGLRPGDVPSVIFYNSKDKSIKRGLHPGPIYSVYNDTGDGEITTRPMPPLKTAMCVAGLKKMLIESTDESEKSLKGGRSVSAQRIADNVGPKKLRFGSKNGRHLYGEHLNISIHRIEKEYTDDGMEKETDFRKFDLGKANLMKDRMWRSLLAQTLASHILSDQALFYSSNLTFKRYRTASPFDMDIESRQPYITVGTDSKESTINMTNSCDATKLSKSEATRIELRLPDSGSNIFLTTLATQAAVLFAVQTTYKQLGRLSKTFSQDELDQVINAIDTNPHAVGTSLQTKSKSSINAFKANSLVLSMMKEVGNREEVESDAHRFEAAIIARTQSLAPRFFER